MLTDLGSNCFGDAKYWATVFCVQSFVDFAILGRVALWKTQEKKGVWVHLLFAANLLLCMLEHTAKRQKS
jgi:hypothetical protein